jgi:hypothetical protein
MAAQMTQPAMFYVFHAARTQGPDFCKPLPCSSFDARIWIPASSGHVQYVRQFAVHVEPFLRKLVDPDAVSLLKLSSFRTRFTPEP